MEFFDTYENLVKRGTEFTKFLNEISENKESAKPTPITKKINVDGLL